MALIFVILTTYMEKIGLNNCKNFSVFPDFFLTLKFLKILNL